MPSTADVRPAHEKDVADDDLAEVSDIGKGDTVEPKVLRTRGVVAKGWAHRPKAAKADMREATGPSGINQELQVCLSTGDVHTRKEAAHIDAGKLQLVLLMVTARADASESWQPSELPNPLAKYGGHIGLRPQGPARCLAGSDEGAYAPRHQASSSPGRV